MHLKLFQSFERASRPPASRQEADPAAPGHPHQARSSQRRARPEPGSASSGPFQVVEVDPEVVERQQQQEVEGELLLHVKSPPEST